MTPWWTEQAAGLIGGLMGGGVGVMGGVLGSVIGYCAPRGIARTAVLGLLYACVVVGVGLVIAFAVALFMGQPWYVSGALALPGFILTVVIGTLIPVVRMRYAQAESRRMSAAGIRNA